MTTQQKTLFLIGPGFIGGTLLQHLKQRRPDLKLTALTRREEQAKELQDLGIEPIKGGLDDASIIKEHASKADIVIHVATADHLESALAVVDGIKSRADKSKKVVYIHTSGNNELAQAAKGLEKASVEDKILSDSQGDEAIEKRLASDAPHRQVDGPLREQLFNDAAEKANNASTTVMMPPLVYGIGAAPWHRISIQAPILARAMMQNGNTIALDRAVAEYAYWDAVSVHDLSEAFVVLLAQLEKHTPGESQPSHYCFPAEPAPFPWAALFDAISSQLQKHAHPAGQASPKVLSDRAAFEDFLGGKETGFAPVFGQIVFERDNCYTRPDRLHALGFKHKAKGVVDSVVNGGELEPLIKE
ncbi:hypothetical protein FA10DRAFT_277298 [Acaromyces ingoldii]|uniref:NAD(P)-binding domain-containing protein n=1 Tax=Acaromyces ingoldii TaxID=215250 RepID=A0A316YXZ4_9BASI|nr:hypothetical protein FA10DRAFT_277298 [Acaromyces ingoldii]PWN93498.1 hypothetical protein FA10DRAFT_277298 [Acaromyces ingoldii]